MTALACLRVDLSAYHGEMATTALELLVHKFAGAYLETRWSWPRRFAPLTDVSFLLTDPRSDDLDVAELRRLSDELQKHLFGTGEEGEVALLVFEGSHPAVTAFAAMDTGAISAALADPERLPAGGRLTRIRPAIAGDAAPLSEAAAPKEESGWNASPAALRRELTQTPPPPPPPAWEGFQGVYFLPRELFYGDVLMYIPQNTRTHFSVVDGAEHAPPDPVAFDMACISMVRRLLSERGRGALLFVPISFSSLVRPSVRDAYIEALSELPSERKSELAAAVYGVPRDPVFTGLRQVRSLLEPHFGTIDLRVTDPGFEIEKLPSEAASSVTLSLPEGDAHLRLSAMRRFGEHLVHYKQRRIWPGVTNVRRKAEVEAAARLRIPFLTGPAICSPVPGAVGGRSKAVADLPMSLAGWMDVHDRQIPQAKSA